MLVKELIDLLNKCNPEDEVKYPHFEEQGIIEDFIRINTVTNYIDEEGEVAGVLLL